MRAQNIVMKCRADFRRFSQIWENTQPGGATLSQSIHFEVQARTRALTESLEQQTATSEVFERPDRVPSAGTHTLPRCFGFGIPLLQIDGQSALHVGIAARLGAITLARGIVSPERGLRCRFGPGAPSQRNRGRGQVSDRASLGADWT
jgi:hypothetical protein